MIKLKSFCTARETITKMKRKPTEWENIFTKAATDKLIISKVHKNFLQPNIRKAKKPNKKIEDLSRHFSKRDLQMAKKHM